MSLVVPKFQIACSNSALHHQACANGYDGFADSCGEDGDDGTSVDVETIELIVWRKVLNFGRTFYLIVSLVFDCLSFWIKYHRLRTSNSALGLQGHPISTSDLARLNFAHVSHGDQN